MSWAEDAGLAILGRIADRGSLHVTLPSGRNTVVGTGEPVGDITFHDRDAVVRTVRGGITGFAEAYMDGRVDTGDLRALLRWAVANQDSGFTHPLGRLVAPSRRLWSRIRPERRHHRVRTMVDHYDLGNDFYAAWLDPSLTYSSARFEHPGQTLGDAQRHKYRTIARHAGLEPGMSVLEIGCGWGGFAGFAAAEFGCRVAGVTISAQQAGFAAKRMADLGLADLVDIRLEDFRAVTGTYDAVVSIEMIESIDETQWPDLFGTISERLDPGGRAVLQAITISDGLWAIYRSRGDFIRQYIFPGGQLPAPKVLSALAATAGLTVEHIETFGLDYARTLAHWHDRFVAAWPQLADDLDDRFRRMWELYLCLCEAGFRSGRVGVEQWVLSA